MSLKITILQKKNFKLSFKPIFFINRFYWPDQSATSQMLTDLTQELSKRKGSIKVLTSNSFYSEVAKQKLSSAEVSSGIFIKRFPSFSGYRHRVISRLMNALIFFLFSFFYLLFKVPKESVVVVMSDPPLMSVFVGFVSKIKRFEFVIWSQDLYPEIASACQKIKKNGFLYKLLFSLRNWSFSSAKVIIAVSEDMRTYLLSSGLKKDKVKVIYNWYKPFLISKSKSSDDLFSDYRTGGQILVGYFGNLGLVHDYKTVKATIQASVDINVRFLFVGCGLRSMDLQSGLSEDSLEKCAFLRYFPRENLHEGLRSVDVHWFSLLPECKNYVMPSKFYGILASGKPCIFVGDKDSEVARIIEDNDLGMIISPGDSKSFLEAINFYKENPSEREKTGVRGRLFFENHYTLNHAVSAWMEILK